MQRSRREHHNKDNTLPYPGCSCGNTTCTWGMCVRDSLLDLKLRKLRPLAIRVAGDADRHHRLANTPAVLRPERRPFESPRRHKDSHSESQRNHIALLMQEFDFPAGTRDFLKFAHAGMIQICDAPGRYSFQPAFRFIRESQRDSNPSTRGWRNALTLGYVPQNDFNPEWVASIPAASVGSLAPARSQLRSAHTPCFK
jgi:hypothetical protein